MLKHHHAQRGSVNVEFVMTVPLLAFAMLFLIGLGYTVMTKQNAVVGARAAVFYRAPRTQVPQPATVNQMIAEAVSPGREQWALDFREGRMDYPDTGSPDIIGGVLEDIYQSFNKEFAYTARGSASLGILPRVMNLGQAQATYSLARGTWTCRQTNGASYTSMLLRKFGLPSPINGWLELTRCESYKETYR